MRSRGSTSCDSGMLAEPAREQMRSKSMAKELKGTVKEILGTAFSVGCTVAGKSPREVQSAIDSGMSTPAVSPHMLSHTFLLLSF